MNGTSRQQLLIGVGLRQPHYAEALSARAALDFIEVHAENFFADGGASRALLAAASEMYPISLHGTALGLGSHVRIPSTHLTKLKALCHQFKPLLISDHLAQGWTTHQGTLVHAGDLLPVSFDNKSLWQTIQNVREVQDTLGRTILVENITSYLAFPSSHLAESEFLAELTLRTGCGLLLDINNLVVNALNGGHVDTDSYVLQWLHAIPGDAVGEIHLAGYSRPLNDLPIIDDHSQPVSSAVWSAYDIALHQLGPRPTLIEWDTNLPAWSTLLQEADKALRLAQEAGLHD